MTSVLGHLNELEFAQEYRKWSSCPPRALFDAPVIDAVAADKKPIAQNITQQARYCSALFIWTDCDREGEHIGSEIRKVALQGNHSLEVKRARFSNTERAHVIRAAQQAITLDDKQVDAVAARQELDLRLGAAFTRFTTFTLQALGPPLTKNDANGRSVPISYDRYFKVRNFIPEEFWSIKVLHKRDSIDVAFSWRRHRLFDRAAVVILFEKCLRARIAKVIKLQKKPTSKWRPLPLTTVELQKLGSMFLRMGSSRVMDIAEKLYQKGFISYPRTETDQFDRGIDLRKLVEKQTQDHAWGPYAQGLLAGAFKQPRSGRYNDQAHPPIHPVSYVSPASLDDDFRRVYEFVVRRFLACCSDDAKGESNTVDIQYGDEEFHASGLIVLERNYLDVYPYDKWTSSQPLPQFRLHETFEPSEAMITDGQTTAPGYLTEPELISLMDANGIGTDATMADHIKKIQEREYVMTRSGPRAGAQQDDRNTQAARGGSVQQFIPTTLGVALIEGYGNIGLETSLDKPFLRKDMEAKMRQICAGTKTRHNFVQETLEQYLEVFMTANQRQQELVKVIRLSKPSGWV
ncbi:MAG: DNA topoisomerase [Ramalina farinacea]|uniref:DNA topoisomerase n=1 Tax=Ramalina farinacea TaxID=258253 RepID=A0AA43TST0_9LECA|nr:DNA topoisomerase [Ramalina farinacea]